MLNVKRLEKELDTEKNHNERLYKKIDRLVAGAYNINKIKAEAIKDFWERLKLKKVAVDSWVVYVESGDNLVKEMAGEKE